MQITSFSGRYDFLSNFYPCSICMGLADRHGWDVYPSLEHAYQAWKLKYHQDRMQVRLAQTPGQAKRLARRFPLREGWEGERLSIMRALLVQKFFAMEMRDRLIDTGDAELIEGNTWGDTFWGVCDGVGHNHLGKLLMQVRSDLIRIHKPVSNI